DGRAAGDDVEPLDGESVARRDRVEHAARGSNDFGAYPVAPDRRDPVARHRRYGVSAVRWPTKAGAAAPIPAPWSLLTATRYASIEAWMMFVLKPWPETTSAPGPLSVERRTRTSTRPWASSPAETAL